MKKRNVFLAMLSACGIVTAFAFIAANTIRSNNSQQSVVSNTAPVYEPYVPQLQEEIKEDNEPGLKPVEEVNEIVDEPVEVIEIAPAKYIMPVSSGEIINEFTDTVLVFHETYGDYRTHLGIDIKAEENTPVLSVATGVVSESYMDYEEGYVVKIEHDDGTVGVYKNLVTNETAPVGMKAEQGEVIGAVGTSGIFESHLPSHLHFELLEDNVEINPKDYLE